MTGKISSHTCPCCGRSLALDGVRSGKVGCRDCHSIFFWDQRAGILTPLKPAPRPRPAQRKYLFPALLAVSILLLIALFLLWLHTLKTPSQPDNPATVIEETRRQLKSLAE